MIDILMPLGEFSRTNCGAICSVLIPLNLLITVATIAGGVFGRPQSQVFFMASSASLAALTLFLHVSTWWWVGIITPISFILFALGTTCLMINWTVVGWLWWSRRRVSVSPSGY